ncbi:MAG: phosphate/phosphite/phosphonate ABC transporter substrate-binding protein [Candidatus Cloacimonadales bacterium]
MKFFRISLLLLIPLFLLSGCGEPAELGSEKNPIKMYFVPSMEAGKIVTSAEEIAVYLEEKTGYSFKVAVPTSYASVIEAMGTKETDIAWLATFAYILANEKFGAEVGLTTVRHGLEKYKGQFIARADSGIQNLEDIAGKTIAYTDAASTSGYIYPAAILKQKNIQPENYIFAGGHPQVVLSVYQGNADVGCTFWSPQADDGKIRDARYAVEETFPDVAEKVKIIGFTEWIPNDTVTFRKDFPAEMREQIIEELLAYAKTEVGSETLVRLFQINDFVRGSDEDYDVVRETLRSIDADAADFMK